MYSLLHVSPAIPTTLYYYLYGLPSMILLVCHSHHAPLFSPLHSLHVWPSNIPPSGYPHPTYTGGEGPRDGGRTWWEGRDILDDHCLPPLVYYFAQPYMPVAHPIQPFILLPPTIPILLCHTFTIPSPFILKLLLATL